MTNYKALLKEYPFIAAWGKFLASYDYYVVREAETAKEESAPKTVIYKNSSGNWVHVYEIVSEDTLRAILRLAARFM